jgi:hypothetical protein
MAANPGFVGTPTSSAVVLAAANTARDGSGTIQTLFTAGAGGARIDAITVKATGTTAAGQVLIWVDDTGAGTAWRLEDEVTVTVVTASNTVGSFRAAILFGGGLTLRAGAIVGATTTIAQGFHVRVRNGGSL